MFANKLVRLAPCQRFHSHRRFIVKRTAFLSLALVGSLSARQTLGDNVIWVGSVSKSFDIAANWSLNRVPTAGDTAIISAATVLVNGITINPDAINLNNGTYLDLLNSPTLNVSNLVFGNTGTNTSASSLFFDNAGSQITFTLGSGVTLSGRIGGIGNTYVSSGNTSTLNTAATINANVSGNTTTIGAAQDAINTLTNTGSITASNGNNLNINAATFTNASGGSLAATSGSTLIFNTNPFNTSTTFTNNSSVSESGGGGVTFNNTSFTNSSGATLNVADTLALNNSTLTNSGTATLSGLTVGSNAKGTLAGSSLITIGTGTVNNGTLYLNGANVATTTLNLNNGAVLDVIGSGTNLNSSHLVFGNTGTNTSASSLFFDNAGSQITFTLGSGVTLSGRIGGIGNTYVSSGNTSTLNTAATINANVSGNTTTIGAAQDAINTLTNTGSITASNGNNLNINAATFTNASGGSLAATSGSTLIFNTNPFNTSTTFTNNSSVSESGGGGVTFNNTSFTNSSGATLNVADTLALNNSTLTNSGTATLSGLTVGSNAKGTLAGSSLITIGTGTVNNGTLYLNGANVATTTLNLNNGAVLDVIGSGTNLNSSHLVFGNTGTNTSASSLFFDNAGSQITFTLGSGVTLSGRIGGIGNTYVSSDHTSTLNTAATINANVSGNTTTIGAAQVAINTLTNTGSITASNGNNLNINAATFTNASGGNLTVGSGSTAVVNSTTFQQTGPTSKTRIDGTLTLNPTFMLQGGILEGSGTVVGNINSTTTGIVNNTGGTLTAGDDTSAGHLTLNCNYTQGANAVMLTQLGGTSAGSDFDLISVVGTATLHGALDVQLLGGFNPYVGESFNFLTYGNRVGSFDSILSLDSGYAYTVSFNDTAGIGTINVLAAAPTSVPEPGAFVMLAGAAFCAGGMFLRRRRKQSR